MDRFNITSDYALTIEDVEFQDEGRHFCIVSDYATGTLITGYTDVVVERVSSGEVSIAHILTQLLVISIQITMVLVFFFAVFKIPNEGSLFLIIIMMLIQGLCGMALGFLISASVCDLETEAIQLALGSFYPLLLLSGVVWPIEAMPTPLYYIALCLPQTLPAESLRALLGRGWNMAYFDVWIGYVTLTGWWIVLLVSATIVLRVKR
ncbi:ABC transporter G family member 20-like [Diadema antillarum]|uniref:ABC transporter G family member 20-like n=1 Tax=Diadema antillarum TaxID=105358 RepID=UPI003A866ABD